MQYLSLLTAAAIFASASASSTRSRALSEMAKIEVSIESIKRKMLSEDCEAETSDLWANSVLKISFPIITQDEFDEVCEEDDYQNLACDLSSAEFYTSISSQCESAGGKVLSIDLSIAKDCYDNSQASASFNNLKTCAGNSCKVNEFQDMIEVVLHSYLQLDSACSLEVSSGARAGTYLLAPALLTLGAFFIV